MPIICLWPNDHLCTVWGSIIFAVSEEMILIQFPIRTYAMQCPVVIAILDFLPGKKPIKNLCTWSTMWLFTYSWRGSIKLYFLRMHFCLDFYVELCYIAVTTMNFLYDHNEFFISHYIRAIPTGVTSITNDFSEKNIFKISVHQKTYWH